MTLFCLLWPSLFYLFWRSVNEHTERTGGTWALVLGSIVALFQFFLGSLINPGGFGVSRWVSACVDIVALPAALPFLVCAAFSVFRIISRDSNFTNLAFLWLIPVAALKALSWSARSDPLLLLGVPVLWTAIVTGMDFFIRIIRSSWGIFAILAIAGGAALPFLAATAYWALFSQYAVAGFVLFAAALVPASVSMITAFLEGKTK
ncbi:MAG: hypothetical protein LBG26_04395 [Treponema sp.]|jgi:hypothetical protein|nr:hypothetical protein [Treponema sp.]